MIEFMQDSLTVWAWIGALLATLLIIIVSGLEIYDALTGADKKRQAQLEKLRRYEELEEDGEL